MQKKDNSHIRKGLIIVSVLIAIDVIMQTTGTTMAGWIKFVPTALLAIGVAISCILYAGKRAAGFGEIFAHGFKTAGVVTCILAIYTFFAVKFIYPPPTAADIDAAAKSLLRQGSLMPAEARAKAIEGYNKMWIIVVSGVIFVSIISGVLGALAGTALAKKNR